MVCVHVYSMGSYVKGLHDIIQICCRLSPSGIEKHGSVSGARYRTCKTESHTSLVLLLVIVTFKESGSEFHGHFGCESTTLIIW